MKNTKTPIKKRIRPSLQSQVTELGKLCEAQLVNLERKNQEIESYRATIKNYDENLKLTNHQIIQLENQNAKMTAELSIIKNSIVKSFVDSCKK